MNGGLLVPAMALVTMGLVIMFALISKRQVENKHQDTLSKNSNMTKDKQAE